MKLLADFADFGVVARDEGTDLEVLSLTEVGWIGLLENTAVTDILLVKSWLVIGVALARRPKIIDSKTCMQKSLVCDDMVQASRRKKREGLRRWLYGSGGVKRRCGWAVREVE